MCLGEFSCIHVVKLSQRLSVVTVDTVFPP